jgi:hypothetical protein
MRVRGSESTGGLSTMPWSHLAKPMRLPYTQESQPRRCIASSRPTICCRPAAVETPGKGGRRHQYLTLEEEAQFLAPFFARAEEGLITTTAEIWRAFETHVGHEVDDSTIYRLLDRHGWRKLMPRPRHPKADPQAKAQFKKTLKRRFKRQSQRGRPKMSEPF